MSFYWQVNFVWSSKFQYSKALKQNTYPEIKPTETMKGLPAPPSAVQVDYFLATRDTSSTKVMLLANERMTKCVYPFCGVHLMYDYHTSLFFYLSEARLIAKLIVFSRKHLVFHMKTCLSNDHSSFHSFLIAT